MSTRAVDRARFRVERLWSDPNPILVRELRQSARLTRTPVALAILTIGITLLLTLIGLVSARSKSPAWTGQVLHQVFFSVAYFVVLLVGPAIAANSIASEREGKTWEALLLTGVPPGTIARGKFGAAFASLSIYVLMLVPVGAITTLFGGVSPIEIVVGFAWLVVVGALGVAAGLALSSKLSSGRVAILVTVLLGAPAAAFAYGIFCVGGSFLAHDLWPSVPEGYPIWVPTAWARAPFDAKFAALLVGVPVVAFVLPAWFLYEATLAALTPERDDRTTGLKRWLVVTSALTAAGGSLLVLSVPASDVDNASVVAGSLGALLAFFSFFVFQGDPLFAPLRVELAWRARKAGPVARAMGPGVVRSSAAVALAAAALVGLPALVALARAPSSPARNQVLVFSAHALGFLVMTAGVAALARARSKTAASARVLLGVSLFGLSVVPWMLAGIVVAFSGGGSSPETLAAASFSPFYAYYAMSQVARGAETELFVGTGMGVLFALVGGAMLVAARVRCESERRRLEEERVSLERRLAEEDAAEAELARGAGAPLEQAPLEQAPEQEAREQEAPGLASPEHASLEPKPLDHQPLEQQPSGHPPSADAGSEPDAPRGPSDPDRGVR